MSTGDLHSESIDIIGADYYAAHGYPHEAWAWLRREAPVYRHDRGDTEPFWAITKHADIIWLSRQPKRFLNSPRIAVFPDFDRPDVPPVRHLLNMDPPDHARFRRLASRRFTPRGVSALRERVERISREILDEIAGEGELREGDFVELVSAPLTLRVLAEMLGVPREDWELMFRWTNETIGSTDPDYQQEGATATETIERARLALFGYFAELVQKRRAAPQDDIVSVLANAELGGEPLPTFELLSYYFLLVVAGNETTRNAMSGGLLAFIENPDQWEKLRGQPNLVDSAVEEVVRWTTPVIQFCRTATEDVELRDQKIRAGDNLCLFYPSANHDEEVFEDPFAFRIERDPNPHLAFGIGEHVCLGAHLARLELRVIFRQLAERLEHIELAGPPARLRSSFVGGIKRMPVRYELRAASDTAS